MVAGAALGLSGAAEFSGAALAADPVPEPALYVALPLTAFELQLQARYFDIPSTSVGRAITPAGELDLSSDSDAWGPSLDAALTRDVVVGGVPLFFGITGFIAGANVDSRSSVQFDGRGAFGVTGLTLGGARSDILATTVNPATATGDLILDGVSSIDTGNISNVESTVGGFSGSVLETLIDRGALASLNVARFDGVPRPTAVGSVATDRAFAVAGAGDLTGVTLTNSFDESLLYFGGDARIGLSNLDLGAARLRPFVGPGYRGYRHDIDTTMSLSTPEFIGPGEVVFVPQTSTYLLDEDLDGNYYGGVAGVELGAPLTPQISLDLRAMGGLYYLDADYSGRQIATIDSGFSVQTITGPSISSSENRAAYLARLEGGLTFVRGNLEIGITGMAEYLSDVPTIDRLDTSSLSIADDALGQVDRAVAGDLGENRPAAGLGFTDLWSFGAGLRVTARF